jgi:cell division protein FtsN
MTAQTPHPEQKNKKDNSWLKDLLIALSFFALGIVATLAWQTYRQNQLKTEEPQKATLIATQDSVADTTITPPSDTSWEATSPQIAEKATDSTTFVTKTDTIAPKKELYYVFFGNFKTAEAANDLKRDLVQGGYSTKMLSPDTESDSYQLVAGPFKSQRRAREQAKSIGYILDIQTSVIKREE